MRDDVLNLCSKALRDWSQSQDQTLPEDIDKLIAASIAPCKDAKHGDWSLSIAMRLARVFKSKPMDLAATIAQSLSDTQTDWLARVEVAAPGFINLFLDNSTRHQTLLDILKRGEKYGVSDKRHDILNLCSKALRDWSQSQDQALPEDIDELIAASIAPCKDAKHGDWSLSIDMRLARVFKSKPMDLANAMEQSLSDTQTDWLARVKVAEPGLINLFLHKTLLEFVSANPTGPLHVGHGRGAVLGDAMRRLLLASGRKVKADYYINDAGRQMDAFALSVLLQYHKLSSLIKLTLPQPTVNKFRATIEELLRASSKEVDDGYHTDKTEDKAKGFTQRVLREYHGDKDKTERQMKDFTQNVLQRYYDLFKPPVTLPKQADTTLRKAIEELLYDSNREANDDYYIDKTEHQMKDFTQNVLQRYHNLREPPVTLPKQADTILRKAIEELLYNSGRQEQAVTLNTTIKKLLCGNSMEVGDDCHIEITGRQMQGFTRRVLQKYHKSFKPPVTLPERAYRGDYVRTMAAKLDDDLSALLENTTVPEFPKGGEVEEQLDAAISSAIKACGQKLWQRLRQTSCEMAMKSIRDELKANRVHIDRYVRESQYVDSGALQATTEQLIELGHAYPSMGALWFRSSDFGDDKDRVLIRDNGQPTYFAADLAYHLHKVDRSYQRLVNIWGADHHGYLARVRAGLEALRGAGERLHIEFLQMVSLSSSGTSNIMSKRAGTLVTLTELREQIDVDALRYFYLSRNGDSALDVDLDIAKSKSLENPVYYLQYAHARLCNLLKHHREHSEAFAKEQKHIQDNPSSAPMDALDSESERRLELLLARYPEVVERAAVDLAPYKLINYLQSLAEACHRWYATHQVLKAENDDKRKARVLLSLAIKQVLANGLELLGINAPEHM